MKLRTYSDLAAARLAVRTHMEECSDCDQGDIDRCETMAPLLARVRRIEGEIEDGPDVDKMDDRGGF